MMVSSMTGFGRSRMTVGTKDITVEIKSVNSRFFDCSVRISRVYSHLEPRIKPFLQELGISRGKVDVSINVEETLSDSEEKVLDEKALVKYLALLKEMQKKYHLKNDISVMEVAKNGELFITPKKEEDAEADWACLAAVLRPAAEAFLKVRAAEGASLEKDLRAKLETIRKKVKEIEALSKDSVTHYRERLAERIREALQDNQITPDESRILTECAIFADKVAIDEELVRLNTHFAAMESILSGSEPVGRRLDFLLQEMNREINTTGSKCQDANVAQLVVDVKCELEKIREQIQNLE